MKEFILYVSPNWKPLAVPGLAHTYMAADQSLNSFQTLPISAFRYWNPQLWMFLFACVTAHKLAYVCTYVHVKFKARVGKESVKEPGAQSHFKSLQTGTLDSRSLAYFSCHSAAKSDYYPTVLGKWALFQSAVTGIWRSASGCMLLLVTGGRIVLVWLSFLFAIKKAWFGEMTYFLNQSLTVEHTFMTGCIIFALRS